MKKQKNNTKKIIKIIKKFSIFTKVLISGFLSITLAFGAGGVVKGLISNDSAISNGAYSSTISVSSGTEAIHNKTYYVNSGNNSAIIGDYFEGYYYDSIFGYFKLDWSGTKSKNVRIIGSTDKCATGYGYKFGGKAKSDNAGYIDFNYSSTKFVYYCLDDEKLYGEAYGKYVGLQKFDGINVKIIDADTVDQTVENTIFVNDTTKVTDITPPNTGIDSNNGFENIGGDIFEFEDTEDSIFYIIK